MHERFCARTILKLEIKTLSKIMRKYRKKVKQKLKF